MIGQIFSSLTGLATSYLDAKAQKQLMETEIRKKQLTGEIDWEIEAIRASASSWKDEAWTICFIAILLASFAPGMQPYVEQGFENLSKAPTWFTWACYASIAASFGIRTVRGFGAKK